MPNRFLGQKTWWKIRQFVKQSSAIAGATLKITMFENPYGLVILEYWFYTLSCADFNLLVAIVQKA
jgi:hypothetical protein